MQKLIHLKDFSRDTSSIVASLTILIHDMINLLDTDDGNMIII